MHAQAGIPHAAHAPTIPMPPHPSLAGMAAAAGMPPNVSGAGPPGLLSAVSQASLMGLGAHPLNMLGKPQDLAGRLDEKRERDERTQAMLEERAVSFH